LDIPIWDPIASYDGVTVFTARLWEEKSFGYATDLPRTETWDSATYQ
jgi:hypothetical protein